MLLKQYYNEHAHEFIESTLDVDLEPIYKKFEAYLGEGDKILDVGFGSGRDSLHFYKRGYEVVSIDYAEEIVRRGKNFLNNEVLLADFKDAEYKAEFNAIWASAVFLHFSDEEILRALNASYNALISSGYVYLSFKYGEKQEVRKGRFFNDFTEETFKSLFSRHSGFEIQEIWLTDDARKNKKGKKWLNIILKK